MAGTGRAILKAALALAMTGLSATAALAAPACMVPDTLVTPHPETASSSQPRRVLPIGGYTLALIWLPDDCRTARPDSEGPRCGAASHRGFVLHGLWPDGEGRDWPQWCETTPILPQRVIRAHYCATPSAQLLQHEWAKHGTCMAGYSPDRYFARSNSLFDAIRFPNMNALSRRRGLTVASFSRAFAAANAGMSPQMVRLNVDARGWLQEVWLCLDRRFGPATCPATQGGAASGAPLKIWRERRR